MSISDPLRDKQHHHHKQQQADPTTTGPNPRIMTPSDAELLKAIDADCKRISNDVPEFPYLLSAPVNVEPRYHYPSRQEAESWQRNTPFYPHEEHLQYITYVYREPGESCFVVRSHLDEERDKLAAQQQKNSKKQSNGVLSAATTRPSTPAGTKKKITLSAWKSKLAGGKAEAKGQSPEKEAQADMESQDMKKVNGVKSEIKAEAKVKKEAQSPASSLKRQRDSDLDRNTTEKSHSVKKQRLSPPPSSKPSSRPSLQPSPIDHPNGAPHGLPALLSPTNPFETAPEKPATPKKKPSNNRWGLPDMLSPTLPPKIEAELAREKEHGRLDSAASSPASRAARTPGSSAPNSTSKPRATDKAEEPRLAKLKDGSKDSTKTSQIRDGDHESTRPDRPSQRKIVRLRYGEYNINRVRKMLRLPPQPDRQRYPLDDGFTLSNNKDRILSKSVADLASSDRAKSRPSNDPSSPPERPKKDGSSKDEHKKDRLYPDAVKPNTKTPEKRPRLENADPPTSSKKQKVPGSLDLEREKKPRTPISPVVPSPSVQKSGGSMKESITVTPRGGHLKAVAMARSASSDTHVATPGGRQSHLTPGAASKSSAGKGPTSAPLTGAKAVELRTLSDQSQKYNKMGRNLKHENQDISNKPKDQQTEPERKRMALLGIECILAYMLAYALGDSRRKLEGRSAEIESSWRTLLPLFKHMRSFVAKYKPLDGLHNYLGVAINARISSVATDRLARSANAPVAADSPQSAIETANPVAENTKIIVESFRAMTDCARDAATKLPIEEITHNFPATWASRATTARDPAWESLINSNGDLNLKGKYWLPIGIDTSPIQAVRFGTQIIKEWIMIEELGYEPRIRI